MGEATHMNRIIITGLGGHTCNLITLRQEDYHVQGLPGLHNETLRRELSPPSSSEPLWYVLVGKSTLPMDLSLHVAAGVGPQRRAGETHGRLLLL